jgi:NADPH:quinone reductase-like Zn-dependent oxidoreductase
MRAVIQRAYGDPDVLSVGEVDVPAPGPGEVLVQVRAAGLDRGTWHIMRGKPSAARLAFGLRRPRHPVPGLDLAGVVLTVGEGVTRFAPGDEVFGIGRGSFASFSVAKESKLTIKPASIGFEQAAAVPVSGLTALQALTNVGCLASGQRVLIIGASCGVGTYAVQIAHHLGAHVTGVCSTGKIELVRDLGADEVIDYTVADPLVGTAPYDLIVNIGGTARVRDLRRALTPRGTLAVVSANDNGRILGIGKQLRAVALNPFVPQRLRMLVSSENSTDLQRLATLLADGSIRPAIDRVYPLTDVASAMQRLEDGLVRGKVVITP